MKLPFKPACHPLLLGGLPHRSAAQALDLSRRYAGKLLAWPEQPRIYIDRGRAVQALDQLALAYLENDSGYASLAADDAAGLEELVRQGDNVRGALALKGQLLGPISLAAQLTDEHDRPLIYDDMLFDALVQHLRLRAEWQETQLLELSDSTIICIDEPFLDTVGLPFVPLDWDRAREQINQTLEGVRGYKGVFAGGAVNWTQVLQTSVDLVIADIYNHSAALVAAAPALPTFLEHEGIVGLSIMPVDEDLLDGLSADHLAGMIASFAEQLEPAGIAPDRLLRQAVISTTNTLSRLSLAAAERTLQLLAEVSKLLREQYA